MGGDKERSEATGKRLACPDVRLMVLRNGTRVRSTRMRRASASVFAREKRAPPDVVAVPSRSPANARPLVFRARRDIVQGAAQGKGGNAACAETMWRLQPRVPNRPPLLGIPCRRLDRLTLYVRGLSRSTSIRQPGAERRLEPH